MSDDNIIDLKDGVRDLKDKLSERWTTEHTHFMELMQAIIPVMNMVGEPLTSVGWLHVVQRAQEWRKTLASQQTILELAIRALNQGHSVAEICALLSVQREQLNQALAMWEPVPKIPAKD